MAKKALYMETTSVSAEKTISQIQEKLRDYNVGRFQLLYGDNGRIDAVYFTIRANGNEFPYRLPANHEPLLELARRGETKYLKEGDEEQAIRIAWRQIYRWVQAQLALIETEMVEMREIFLPYMMVDDQTTMYQKMLNNGFAGYLEQGHNT